MAFKFNATGNNRKEGSGERKQVDFEAMNAHVIEAAGTAKKARSIPGVISGIIDLGEQERPDFEAEFKGTEEELQKELAEKEGSYSKKVGSKTFIYTPQRPAQQVAITVDFPQILVDKGQYFGNSNPQPLRMLLNGEFMTSDKVRIVGRPYNVTEVKHDDGTWAFAKNSQLHKLAEATDSLDELGYFHKEDLGDLLGKVAQFQFRVYMKPSKQDASRTFFTEEIKLAGMVPEGVPSPDFDESILYGVNLNGEQDEASVKVLRASIKNTIKRALNYETSDIKPVLEKVEGGNGQKPASRPAPAKTEESDVEPEGEKGPNPDDFDDDVPF